MFFVPYFWIATPSFPRFSNGFCFSMPWISQSFDRPHLLDFQFFACLPLTDLGLVLIFRRSWSPQLWKTSEHSNSSMYTSKPEAGSSYRHSFIKVWRQTEMRSVERSFLVGTRCKFRVDKDLDLDLDLPPLLQTIWNSVWSHMRSQ